MLALFDDLRAGGEMTILVVSHDPSLGGHADRRLLLEAGEIREDVGSDPVAA